MDTEAVGRLRAVIVKLSRQLNASATAEGLTPSQASALGIIAFRGPISLTDLAAVEGLNPTMVSRIIGKLDDARLIRRVPNPSDLRSANVEATEDGTRLNEIVRTKRAMVVSECVARLAPGDQVQLTDALPVLEALAEELKRSVASSETA